MPPRLPTVPLVYASAQCSPPQGGQNWLLIVHLMALLLRSAPNANTVWPGLPSVLQLFTMGWVKGLVIKNMCFLEAHLYGVWVLLLFLYFISHCLLLPHLSSHLPTRLTILCLYSFAYDNVAVWDPLDLLICTRSLSRLNWTITFPRTSLLHPPFCPLYISYLPRQLATTTLSISWFFPFHSKITHSWKMVRC